MQARDTIEKDWAAVYYILPKPISTYPIYRDTGYVDIDDAVKYRYIYYTLFMGPLRKSHECAQYFYAAQQ